MADRPIEIVTVSARSDRRRFFEFPWLLYRDDPHWVPPLRMNQWELLNYRPHPFYLTAEIQTFYARRGSLVVGRIAAIIDHAHNKTYDEKRGKFGFFEAIDDVDVARALFAAAEQWLRARGQTAIRGPENPSQNYEWGLLIEGFDRPPTFMMTYNPPYYAGLLEACGFVKAQDLFSFWGHVRMLEKLDKTLGFVTREATRRFSVAVRPLDPKHFMRDVLAFLNIYNRALPGQWGFVPLSSEELKHIATGLKYLIVPNLTTIAEVDGQPIGAVFGLLDYNPLVKKIDGRLFPFGFLRLLLGRKKLQRVRLVSTNVIPEYQRWGIGLVLLQRLIGDVLKWGITEGEFSWVLESNHLSRRSLENGGALRTHTFRIYDKPL
jgi:GNAT superfamily N-acetyltransferase